MELADPVEGAAPGQGLVLYGGPDGDIVLGGGRMLIATKREASE